MKNLYVFLILGFFLTPFIGIAPAKAEIRIDMTQGVTEPLPIAISPFHPTTTTNADLATKIPEVIAEDLASSGLFKPISRSAYVQTPQSINDEGVRFGEWRAINAQAMVTGVITQTEDGRTRVEFRLWDVFSEKQLTGMAYMTGQDNWRRIAHIIADEIYKRLTGEQGYFDSRIVYVSESGSTMNRVKRLAIMDQDGANHRYLTDGGSLVLTPRFSPASQQIAYMSYERGAPRVYLYDINTGRHEVLGNFPGMTFAPRFSPDGGKVVMSLAQGGNTDIYVMDLASRQPKKITTDPGIDTAPSYSPDGRQIVFESDRGGTQQLYVMDAGGGSAKRVTFGKGRYANPVWSPRGDLIAFTRMFQGQFYIGVIRPDGSGERLLSTAYHVEGPSWAPNGRVLTFFKEQGKGASKQASVFTIDITGYNERKLPTPQGGSDPAWSPLNK